MVFARTSKAAARLTAAFRERQVQKKYLAVVEGRLVGAGQWRDDLIKENRSVRVVSAAHPRGKQALLCLRALGHESGTTLSTIQSAAAG